MLSSVIEGVYALLLEQKQLQEALLALARDKREAAIRNDTERLTDIVSREYAELSKMKKVEKRRTALLADAEESIGKPARDITVSDLIEIVKPDTAQRLAALQAELVALIGELRMQNDENGMLVRTQLEYTDTMLEVLAGTDDPLNNFYGTDGQSREARISRGLGLLDTEV